MEKWSKGKVKWVIWKHTDLELQGHQICTKATSLKAHMGEEKDCGILDKVVKF